MFFLSLPKAQVLWRIKFRDSLGVLKIPPRNGNDQNEVLVHLPKTGGALVLNGKKAKRSRLV